MNKEVIKAINKKEKKHNLRKWWNKNGYKIMRAVFFPIWLIMIIWEKINHWLDSREEMNEEKIDEILDYYIPRRAKWDSEDKSFYFFDNGFGWNANCAKKYLKRKDRRFWKVNCGLLGGEIRLYLINDYELEGFTKEIGYCLDGWTEITFKMN